MKRTISLLMLCAALALLAVAATRADWTIWKASAQQPQHTEIKIDSRLFDEFVGQYSFVENPDLVLSFWREGDKFFLQATNQGKAEIFPESQTKFFLKVIDAQVTFGRDAQSKVSGGLWRQGNRDSQLQRISDQPAIEVLQPFEKREALIPMRDGVRLHTVIFSPQQSTEALPILIDRTPYGVSETSSDGLSRRYK